MCLSSEDMRFIHQKQLPDGRTRTTRIQGWIAALVSFLILFGLVVILVASLPFILIGIIAFIGFILFLLVGGWIYLGFRIGFPELWEVTKLVFGIGWGKSPDGTHAERVRKLWEDRIKGRHGVWRK